MAKRRRITKATLKAWNKEVDQMVMLSEAQGDQRLANVYAGYRVVADSATAREINADKETRRLFFRNTNLESIVKHDQKLVLQDLSARLQVQYGFTPEQTAKLEKRGWKKVLNTSILKNRNVSKALYGTPVEDTDEEKEELANLLKAELNV